ncbi:MAG: HYR domain-containing protein, partial [Bacteroidia bacterium]|nr:HYR domain-containing protein [Bacteroidia bacterium]
GSCELVVPDLVAQSTATDNCTYTLTQSPLAGAALASSHNQAHSVTLTATDAAGNSATCTVTLTAKDVTAPVITCPATQNLALNATCSALLPDYRALATISDNCSSPEAMFITQSPASGSGVSGVGTTTVTITATDAGGNTASCSFTVNRVDVIAPEITCPAAQSIILNASCSATLPDYRGLATVSDNCTAPSSIVKTQSPAPGSTVSGAGTATVTLTATDASGNTANCSFSVNKVDNINPVITCPANINLTACTATASWSTPVATDNCGAVTVTQIAGPPSGSTFANGSTTTITFRATDGSANSATCSFTVTRIAALVVNAGANDTSYYGYSADQTIMHTATVTGGVAPYTYSWTMNRALKCNMVTNAGDETFSSGSCTYNTCPSSPLNTTTAAPPVCTGNATITAILLDTATVTVTVTDANGCTASSSFRIQAEDARCFAGNSQNAKVQLCHKTNSNSNPWTQLCVDESAVASHLAHGDYLGKCGKRVEESDLEAGMEINVYPNPNNGRFTLEVHSDSNQEIKLLMTNVIGEVVINKTVSIPDGIFKGTLDTRDVNEGYYILSIIQGDKRVTQPIIIMK